MKERTEYDIQKVIEKTVNATVLKLKMSGLMKDDRKTAYQKTEEILSNYNIFCESDQPYAKKITRMIDDALEEVKDDIYYEIIPMIYFQKQSREAAADYFKTTVTTISRNKKKTGKQIKSENFQ